MSDICDPDDCGPTYEAIIAKDQAEIERLRADVEQRQLVLEAKNARIDALSGEFDKAREVLLEMDKIVAGHVAEVERLRVDVEHRKATIVHLTAHVRDAGIDCTQLRALNAEMLAAMKEAMSVDCNCWQCTALRVGIAKAEGQS